MSKRVKLTIAAANVLLRAIKWRTYSTEYQVMVRKECINDKTGRPYFAYSIAYARQRWAYDHPQRIWAQDSYRDALLEIDRLSEADRPNAVIFRIKTERPA